MRFQAHKAQGSGGESRFPLTEMGSITPAGSETRSILGQDLNLVLLLDLGPQSVSCNHTLIQHSLLIAPHYHTKQNNKHKGYSRDEGNDMGIDSIIRKHVKERRLGT